MSSQHSPSLSVDRPARAVEVAAMLGDSVVGVAHCLNPRGGKIARATWALLAAGIAGLFAGSLAFAGAIWTEARNAAALERHVQVLKRPARMFRPELRGAATDVVGIGGLALGLAALTLGLARARAERRSPHYRIGTAPGVNLPLEGAPADSFPLVAPDGDGFVFNRGAGIDGELLVGGTATPLGELAGVIRIPDGARIRARLGRATIFVSAVDPPPQRAAAASAWLDGAMLKYVTGSLAAHAALLLLLSQVAPDGGSVRVGIDGREPLGTRITSTAPDEAPPPAPDYSGGDDDGEDGSEAPKPMALDAGKAGDRSRVPDDAQLRVKDRDVDPQLAREAAIEAARSAGPLGSHVLRDSIHALTANTDFDSGFDPDSQHGLIDGTGIRGGGTFGATVSGPGLGGGCFSPPCGIVATASRYGTIVAGRYAGDRYGINGGRTGGLRGHGPLDPCAGGRCIGTPRVEGDFDRAIIKRYIKRHESKIAYCYEKELLVHPDLAGTIAATFLIGPTGAVQSSDASGFDPAVASCVAGVIRDIRFPAIPSGGTAAVKYPFTFRATGG